MCNPWNRTEDVAFLLTSSVAIPGRRRDLGGVENVNSPGSGAWS